MQEELVKIQALAIAAQIEAFAMQAENFARIEAGLSLAYTEQDFMNLIRALIYLQ